MKAPCELIVSKVLPAIRAEIVKKLSSKHNMKQTEISSILGITQASVSQYLTSARGASEMLKHFPEIEEYAEKIADRIAKGDKSDCTVSMLCEACIKIRTKKKFCKIHREKAGLENCFACEF
ncbi:MAG: ArsR family transcriptional regulator [Thermoplasmata archaeon]